MAVFNELLTVASYLRENSESNPSFGDLYEIVQYTGNILPRLYLMITVGAVYIKLNVAPRKEILLDLLDMCRGIQHPVRGLFVREYLCSMLKDLLPTSEGTKDSKYIE
jgi:vacuolar protein sorting-associated protein 35